MYQFNQSFSNLDVEPETRNYRYRGLAVGLLGGWLPAWGVTHLLQWGGWGFALIWILSLPTGYYLGKTLRTKYSPTPNQTC